MKDHQVFDLEAEQPVMDGTKEECENFIDGQPDSNIYALREIPNNNN